MSLADIIRSILELAVISFVIWGLFHEDRFVSFENKIAAYFRRKGFKVIRGNSSPAFKSAAKTAKRIS